MSRPLITRVVLRDFRSIAACEAALGPLTFLLGDNGSGKGNFLDALRFVSDCLRRSLDDAVRVRGGFHEVVRRSSGPPTKFGIRIEFDLERGHGHFAVLVAGEANGRYAIEREECVVNTDDSEHRYSRARGVLRSTIRRPLAPAAGQLYLVRASGRPPFFPVCAALAGMAAYHLDPEAMRRNQPPTPGWSLRRDGGDIASVLSRLEEHSPESKKGIEEYLGLIVSGIVGVRSRQFGPERGVEFLQRMRDGEPPQPFHSATMSDGALRALGVFTALFQTSWNPDIPRFVAIEEPETVMHPPAAGVLLGALREAAETTQVLVTTHSPELLDDKHLTADQILAAEAQDGLSRIAPIDEAGRGTIRDRLATAGELLRLGQIRPAPEDSDSTTGVSGLFERVPSTGAPPAETTTGP